MFNINNNFELNRQMEMNNSMNFIKSMLAKVGSFDPYIHPLKEWEKYLQDRLSLGEEVLFQRELSKFSSSNEGKKHIYKELDELRERYLAFSK